MKIRIDMSDSVSEDEIVIRCKTLTEEVLEIQKLLLNRKVADMKFLVEDKTTKTYLDTNEIVFLESDSSHVAVHTCDKVFYSSDKLYKLEELLPNNFIRISKSSIVNVDMIRAIHKNITGASEIEFVKTVKKTYASRNYVNQLIDKLEEKRSKL